MRAGTPPLTPTPQLARMRIAIACSEPRHQRCVDDIRQALRTARLDGHVHVLQGEAMRGDLLERDALRRQLLQRELARLVAVATRAFQRHELDRLAAYR